MAEEAEFGGKCAFAVALGGPEKAPAGKAKYDQLDQTGRPITSREPCRECSSRPSVWHTEPEKKAG